MDGITTGRLLALIRRFTGDLSSLATTDKSNLVAAINEVAQGGGGGGGGVNTGLGLVEENGVIRLAVKKTAAHGTGQVELNIAEQYNTPYSYNDDEDIYEDNPTPYVIDFNQITPLKFTSTTQVGFGRFMMTPEQAATLKPDLQSILAITHWSSGWITRTVVENVWVSNGFYADINLNYASPMPEYPDIHAFDTIESVELVMLKTTTAYGYNIGTFIPQGSNIYVRGQYWG